MIRFLYKYMPMRFDFFKDLMIRATPALALNDPFELKFNNTQVRDANKNQMEFYRNAGKDVRECDNSMLDDICMVMQSDLMDLGAISFTEDCNNPLMWAHYADNHKGFVIEFDFKEPFFSDSIINSGGRMSRFGNDCFGEVFEYPEKVNYRREMPSFERSELSSPDSMDEFHWKKFNKAILYTKSDDWIYEKEQRSIVRLRDADSIICKHNNYIREICRREAGISLVERGDGKIQVTFPNEYEMHEKMGDESIKDEVYRHSFCNLGSTIHLFRINPLAISGVYFGCNANYNDALYNIKQNTSLKSLNNIFTMKRNEYFYRFDKVPLR